MLSMFLLGFSLVPTSSAATPAPVPAQLNERSIVPPFALDEPREGCPNPAARMAEEGKSVPRARRLDELPPGRLEYAVYRAIDGCAIPAVVHENIGNRFGPEKDDRP